MQSRFLSARLPSIKGEVRASVSETPSAVGRIPHRADVGVGLGLSDEVREEAIERAYELMQREFKAGNVWGRQAVPRHCWRTHREPGRS